MVIMVCGVVARSEIEIEFFVIGRVVRYVHFTILSGDRTIGVEHDCCVVVQSGCASFEKRGYQDDVQLTGDTTVKFGRFSRYGFCQIEAIGRFCLTEIEAVMTTSCAPFAAHCSICCFSLFLLSAMSPVFCCWIIPTVIFFSVMTGYIYRNTFRGYCMVTQCNEPCCRMSGEQSIPTTSRFGNACRSISNAFLSFKGCR